MMPPTTPASTYRQARSIGFTRRDIFKYAALASGAMIVAACSGNNPALPDSECVEGFL